MPSCHATIVQTSMSASPTTARGLVRTRATISRALTLVRVKPAALSPRTITPASQPAAARRKTPAATVTPAARTCAQPAWDGSSASVPTVSCSKTTGRLVKVGLISYENSFFIHYQYGQVIAHSHDRPIVCPLRNYGKF